MCEKFIQLRDHFWRSPLRKKALRAVDADGAMLPPTTHPANSAPVCRLLRKSTQNSVIRPNMRYCERLVPIHRLCFPLRSILHYRETTLACLKPETEIRCERNCPTGIMVDDDALEDWFCREVLPLERSLTHFIRRNWRVADDVADMKHDVYELAIGGARNGLPMSTRSFLFTIARNHLINQAKRARIVSFDLVADLETIDRDFDMFEAERHLDARDALRRVQAGLEKLSPRVREIVRLRKIEGLNVQETAERLGIGKDAVNHQVMMGMKALADYMLGGTGRIVRQKFRRRQGKGSET